MWLWLRRLTIQSPHHYHPQALNLQGKVHSEQRCFECPRTWLALKEVWDNLGHQGAENNPTGRGELPGEGRLFGML